MKWLAAIALVIWVAWSLAFPTYTLRWKLMVEVETPQGVRSASSVLESSFFRTSGAIAGTASKLKGQAVFVDLGEGKHIIALLVHGKRGEEVNIIAGLPVTAITEADPKGPTFKDLLEGSGTLTGKAELKPPLIPTLVNFADLKDANTARVLVPFNGAFEVAFGPGYRFRSATVEIVPAGWWPFSLTGLFGEPVTRGIEVRLPWWNNANRPAAAALRAAHLVTGAAIGAEHAFTKP